MTLYLQHQAHDLAQLASLVEYMSLHDMPCVKHWRAILQERREELNHYLKGNEEQP